MTDSLALIIEDDPNLAHLFELILKELAFEIEVVRDGQGGLDRLGEISPAVVMLDMNLPGVSGLAIAQHIRSEPRLAGVKVIVVTANPNMGEAAQDYADLVLQKPISYVQMRDLIRRIV